MIWRMPIRYAISACGAIETRQSFDSPTIYLDHWAMMKIAEDDGMRERFVCAVRRLSGTLFLSHRNLAEFARPQDQRHAWSAGRFLDQLMPNVYLAEVAVDRAIAQEEDPRNRGVRLPPPPDREFLFIVSPPPPYTTGAMPLSACISEVAEQRARLLDTVSEVDRAIASSMADRQADPAFVKKAKHFLPEPGDSATLTVLRELLRAVALDARSTVKEQDGSDLQHAVVSVAYCDYVLLDGRWAEMVRQLDERLLKHNVQIAHARCFSPRRQGLEGFLAVLESLPTG